MSRSREDQVVVVSTVGGDHYRMLEPGSEEFQRLAKRITEEGALITGPATMFIPAAQIAAVRLFDEEGWERFDRESNMKKIAQIQASRRT